MSRQPSNLRWSWGKTLNFWSSCPHLLSTGIIGVPLHTRLTQCWRSSRELRARLHSFICILPTELHAQPYPLKKIIVFQRYCCCCSCCVVFKSRSLLWNPGLLGTHVCCLWNDRYASLCLVYMVLWFEPRTSQRNPAWKQQKPTTDLLGNGVQSEHFLPEPGAEASIPDITIISANCTMRQRKHRERCKDGKTETVTPPKTVLSRAHKWSNWLNETLTRYKIKSLLNV